MPPHLLNLYQKPTQGTDFIRQYACINYRHKITAVGGFESASCDLIVSAQEGERFLEQMLGNRVAVFVDNPREAIWEGYIARITFEYGQVVYSIGLDELSNRIIVSWNKPDATPPQQKTISADNTDSQAVYGIKAMAIDLNVNFTADGAAKYPRVVRNTELKLRAWPQTTASYRGGGGAQPVVRLEMRGFHTTLEWSIYDQSASAEVALSTLLTTVITGNDNGSTFFDDTDTSLIEANTVVMDQKNDSNLSRWQFAQQIVEGGDDDATQYRKWIMGVTPTDPNTGARRFYYRRARATVVYTTRLRDQTGAIRNKFNRPVAPWRVRPDAGIQITDALPGWQGQFGQDDPRVVYLETVDYDGERGLVSFQSSDDLSVEGVFRLRKMNKPVNARFGIVRSAY